MGLFKGKRGCLKGESVKERICNLSDPATRRPISCYHGPKASLIPVGALSHNVWMCPSCYTLSCRLCVCCLLCHVQFLGVYQSHSLCPVNISWMNKYMRVWMDKLEHTWQVACRFHPWNLGLCDLLGQLTYHLWSQCVHLKVEIIIAPTSYGGSGEIG
jgi:hypothetical protein